MKKYFGNQKNFTLEELKTIVSNNPQLGFYYSNKIICSITGTITIHNWNNGYKGKNSREFYPQQNGTWESR
jgi:Uma2 family endonuclease